MAIAIEIVINWNWRLKNSIFKIATEPLKKNKVLNVDNTNFLFFIPLPRTWEFEEIEKRNQKTMKIVFKYDQELYVRNNIISVEKTITDNSPK